ncbi:hypothetical protein [Luteimonas changyuni]|uniref:hypothetical protein n=1 Tax=Luteimonas sp. MJ145 TaxID=3129234 RepID=UPI0031BB4356
MYRTDANVSFAASHAAASVSGSAKSGSATGLAPRYRSRDFGTGYGSSSGYAAARRYAPGGQPAPRFRLI